MEDNRVEMRMVGSISAYFVYWIRLRSSVWLNTIISIDSLVFRLMDHRWWVYGSTVVEEVSRLVKKRFKRNKELQDLIKQGKISLDAFFIYSILRDIINVSYRRRVAIDWIQGLNYIHHSPLICHGNISSECCLVDERWVVRSLIPLYRSHLINLQVKISYYGLHWIRSQEKRRKKDLLWTAPEHLRLNLRNP